MCFSYFEKYDEPINGIAYVCFHVDEVVNGCMSNKSQLLLLRLVANIVVVVVACIHMRFLLGRGIPVF